MENLGIYLSLFFLLLGVVVFSQSFTMGYYSEYGPGPGLLPLWTGGLIIVLSLFYLWFSIKKEIILFSKAIPKGEGLINVITCMGSLILFMIIVPFTGFLIGSTITLLLLFKRGYKWPWAIGLSVTVSLVVFGLFDVLLQVPLPVNEFGW
ncbi:tripartite tricarboxylate transporter TctB family protein [Neobacillus drentensis]|uniref:tripartite tricarboxylate transporter TctB family protein n=1 Tax=Neobacillus drentensis TaxID=220684 RepID=UPI002FFE807C